MRIKNISCAFAFLISWSTPAYCRRGEDDYYSNSDPLTSLFQLIVVILLIAGALFILIKIIMFLAPGLDFIFGLGEHSKDNKEKAIAKKSNTPKEIKEFDEIEKPKEIKKVRELITYTEKKSEEYTELSNYEVGVFAGKKLEQEHFCESIHKFSNYKSALEFYLSLEKPPSHAKVLVVRDARYNISSRKNVTVLLRWEYWNDIDLMDVFPKVDNFTGNSFGGKKAQDELCSNITVINHE